MVVISSSQIKATLLKDELFTYTQQENTDYKRCWQHIGVYCMRDANASLGGARAATRDAAVEMSAPSICNPLLPVTKSVRISEMIRGTPHPYHTKAAAAPGETHPRNPSRRRRAPDSSIEWDAKSIIHTSPTTARAMMLSMALIGVVGASLWPRMTVRASIHLHRELL